MTEIIKEITTSPENSDLDCYSRAFYLAGVIEEERPLEPNEIKSLMDSCIPTRNLEVGTLVHFYNGEKSHIGVVTELNPAILTDRSGKGGDIRENVPLVHILLEYGGLDISLCYLKPKSRFQTSL